MRQIRQITHSIAFTDENGVIYLNKHLKTFNEGLYNRILKHEKGHTRGLYNKQDFLLDYKNDISQWDLLKFCLRHPSGFVQLIPIIKVGDTWFYSWLSLLKLVILGSIIGGVIWIFKI